MIDADDKFYAADLISLAMIIDGGWNELYAVDSIDGE